MYKIKTTQNKLLRLIQVIELIMPMLTLALEMDSLHLYLLRSNKKPTFASLDLNFQNQDLEVNQNHIRIIKVPPFNDSNGYDIASLMGCKHGRNLRIYILNKKFSPNVEISNKFTSLNVDNDDFFVLM
jgi:hypothetical protein